MMILLTVIHVLVCVFLVIVVLLQSGKAADLAGAFGGMGSQTAFGPRGAATVLSKATTIAAGLFMVTSLTLAILATKNAGTGSSVLERQKTTVRRRRLHLLHASGSRPPALQRRRRPWLLEVVLRASEHCSGRWTTFGYAGLRQRSAADGSDRRE